MAEIKTDQIGQIQISDEVIAIIAGTAALEIDGVAGMSGNITGGLAEMLGRKNLAKGVKVQVSDDSVVIDIDLLIKFGYKIHEVCVNVQQRVKTAIETMTSLNAGEVNINVLGLHVDKESNKDVEA